MFPPVVIGEQRLIDGGVVNNTPISRVVALGAQRVYVLPTQAGTRALGRPPEGPIDVVLHSLALLLDARFAADVARFANEVELVVRPAPNARPVQPTDFDHAELADRRGPGRVPRAALGAARARRGRVTDVP